jgi:NADPH:quinone reductase-like Zn-dependent oxidoreductase
MRAIVYDKYGSFGDLELRDIAKPVIKEDEVLVRIGAPGLHVGDCLAVRGRRSSCAWRPPCSSQSMASRDSTRQEKSKRWTPP